LRATKDFLPRKPEGLPSGNAPNYFKPLSGLTVETKELKLLSVQRWDVS